MEKRSPWFGLLVIVAAIVVGTVAKADAPRAVRETAAVSSEDGEGHQKPLEVNGQSRNLNMMLVLRNDKDKIKFVKVRENYREEILEQTKKE